MRVLLFSWVVSLALLGIGELPARGNGLKACKGKVGDVTTRWLSKVGPQVCMGAAVLLVSLSSCTPALKQRALERNVESTWGASRAKLHTTLMRQHARPNEVEALVIGVTMHESGELLTTLTHLKVLDELLFFKKDAGVSHRVTKLEELAETISTARPDQINPEVREYLTQTWKGTTEPNQEQITAAAREYFIEMWKDAATSELVIDMYLLKDELRQEVMLDAFPQLQSGRDKYNDTTAKKLKNAVSKQQYLLSEYFQGNISRETYRKEYASYRAYASALEKQAYGISKYPVYRSIASTGRLASVRGRNVRPEDYGISKYPERPSITGTSRLGRVRESQ